MRAKGEPEWPDLTAQVLPSQETTLETEKSEGPHSADSDCGIKGEGSQLKRKKEGQKSHEALPGIWSWNRALGLQTPVENPCS